MPKLSDAVLKRGPTDVAAVKLGLLDAGAGGGGALPEIEGLFAHYDASTLEDTPDTVIASWPDASGNGHNVTDITGSLTLRESLAALGDQPGVEFPGGNNYAAENLGVTASQPNTIFAVAINANISATHSIFDGMFSRNTMYFTTSGIVNFFADSTFDSHSATPTVGDAHIITGLFNGASSLGRVDGVEEALSLGTGSFQGIRIGANNSGGNDFEGVIAELIIYDAQLTTEEIESVEAYLSGKYGITLS